MIGGFLYSFKNFIRSMYFIIMSIAVIYCSILTLNIEIALGKVNNIPIGVPVSVATTYFLFRYLRGEISKMRLNNIVWFITIAILFAELIFFTGVFRTHYNLIYFTYDRNGLYTVIYDSLFIYCLIHMSTYRSKKSLRGSKIL